MDVGTRNSRSGNTRAWLGAMRLRTLPLALSTTFTGAFLAQQYLELDVLVLVLTALTTILLQINSNLANDFGDFEHGTDNDERIGPERALQSGAISSREMKNGIRLTSSLSFISGIILIWIVPLDLIAKAVFLLLGSVAIYASIRYTAGTNPYGYKGLGDVAVMAFFGFLGVIGAFVCQTGEFYLTILLPAIGIGALSTAVLNVNNTRDIESDTNADKITLAVKLGPKLARRYHLILLTFGAANFVVYALIQFDSWKEWLFVLTFPLLIINGLTVYKSEAKKLDPMLKQLAISTFLISLLLGIGQWV
ncbi:MAG: 1,4-dihydroxy-2-naphthoate octaprenyltransferase [Bacteroidetes bacterium]|nr:1,4-dihydroxy-2-naphthoate octaprenyltransferase [Bacteroidota bacterium]